MSVQIDPGALRKDKPKDYVIRFAFGGIVTLITGVITMAYGPVVGGLFLGFPAILPASLTLVKEHDGEEAAGEDAMGALMGSGGLMAFGALVWGLATRLPGWAVLLCAAATWLIVSVALWLLLRRVRSGGQPDRPNGES